MGKKAIYQCGRDRLSVERLEPRQMLAADPILTEFMASNDSTLVDGNGESSDWIELHNADVAPIDFSGWYLTDDASDLTKWQFPSLDESVVDASEYLVVFASGEDMLDPSGNLHTGFKLSAGGEYVALVDPSLNVVSEYGIGGAEYPSQTEDVSYGIDSNGTTGFFYTPTPGAANSLVFSGFVDDTAFSIDRGFYTESFSVDVTTDTVGATIVYTTDGSKPSLLNGTQVFVDDNTAPTATVTISTTTTLRAAAFKPDYEPTNVDTQTYIFTEDVIQQSNTPAGFPGAWGAAPAVDYEMDPEIVNNPAYTQDLLDGLQDIPTLSLVSNVNDIFGPGGIYSNTLNDTLEIETSAEWITVDGSEGFQLDAGLKIAGGASREVEKSPKHSMSLRFRGEYGAGRLNHPLFEGSEVESFNTLQLRAMFNNSWIHWLSSQQAIGTLIRDQFIRDSLIAMGQDDAGHGTYAHLYINGLYWGVYNVHERQDSAHYAEYNGGDPDDYDALNAGAAIDGDLVSYNAMRATVVSQDWAAIQQVLDVENFADWTIIQAYGGNADLKVDNNWRAAGGGSGGGLWKSYAWDVERTLEGVTSLGPDNMVDPMGILDDLVQIPEFVTLFGDRLQKHFYNDGALTPEATAERWNARVDELQLAIVAESARWGDYRRDVHQRGANPQLYERDVHWNNEVNRLVTTYFPGRTDFLIQEYTDAGLLPEIAAPSFLVNGISQHGGAVLPGDNNISLTVPDGQTVISDSLTVINASSPARALVPSSNALETGTGPYWYEESFNPVGWQSGTNGIGYEKSGANTYDSYLGIDVESAWDANQSSVYTRFEFDLASDYTQYNRLALDMIFDDGFVAYLNGVAIEVDPVGNTNLGPETAGWQSHSTGARGDSTVLSNPLTFDLTAHIGLLHAGTNVLAIHGLNQNDTSSDFLMLPELRLETATLQAGDIYYTTDGSDPGPSGAGITGTLYTAPLPLSGTSTLKARTLNNGEWSALAEATFTTTSSIVGDFNGDNITNAADYTLWRDSLDTSVQPFTGADGNGDGQVTQADKNVWRSHYGYVLPTASAFATAIAPSTAAAPAESLSEPASENRATDIAFALYAPASTTSNAEIPAINTTKATAGQSHDNTLLLLAVANQEMETATSELEAVTSEDEEEGAQAATAIGSESQLMFS